MPHTKFKKGVLLFILSVILFRHLGVAMERHDEEPGSVTRFESTVLEDMRQAFQSILFHPSDMFPAAFSNPGWSY